MENKFINIEVFAGLVNCEDFDQKVVDCSSDTSMDDWELAPEATFATRCELKCLDFVFDMTNVNDDAYKVSLGTSFEDYTVDYWNFENGEFHVELFAANEHDGELKLKKFIDSYCK